MPDKWLANHRETGLWSGVDASSILFTRVPQWSIFKQLAPQSGPRIKVYYFGNSVSQEGEAYADAVDLGPIDAPAQIPPVEPDPTQHPSTLREQVMAYGMTLLGTPYCFGGKRPDETSSYGCTGIDCSGFVCETLEHCGVSLGNRYYLSAEAIRQIATQIDSSQLQPGDLVFFHTTYGQFGLDYATHIGFYKGPGEFLNANEAQGVGVTNLNSPFWQQHWLSAGRVLPA